jgi:hypothetical protein
MNDVANAGIVVLVVIHVLLLAAVVPVVLTVADG